MSGFGGGGFALIRTANMRPKILDFFCQTPFHRKDISELDFESVEVQFSETSEEFHVGKGAVAVPGMVRGIFELHDRLGTVPLKILAEPAIELARNGAEVDWFQAYDFQLLEVIFKRSADAQSIFYDNGKRLVEGSTIRNSLFAELLHEVVNDGARAFYESEVAEAIADDFTAGGLLTAADFKYYTAQWRDALQLQCQGFNVFTNPRPGRGGVIIAETLRALDQSGKNVPVFGSDVYTQWMLQGLKTGARSAEEHYTKWGSTTHVSTADNIGNAVSVSVSNGEGSGYFAPGTGIQLNNMLGEAALFPNGFHSWQPNTRVQSLMSPTVLEQVNGDAIIALGTGGAGRIPVALSQVISHLIFDRASIHSAINRGRVYVHGDTLEMEPGLKTPESLADPVNHCNQWSQNDMFFGGVHAAAIENGGLQSVGDVRRNGAVATWN